MAPMLKLIRLVLLCLMAGSAGAQKNLPNCLGSQTSQWTNCFGSKSVASGNYEGEWKDGRRSGHGTFKNIDGRKYIGDWKNDNRDGRGIQYSADGTVVASGEWYEGKLVGSFVLDVSRYPFVSTTKVSSSSDVIRTSENEIATNGNKYVGEWKGNKRDGRGIEYRADGSVALSGDWYEGKLVGSYEIDKNLFPFNSSTHLGPAYALNKIPTYDPNAGLEAERKNRISPDDQTSFSKERERITAELDAERRKRQELQVELDRAKELAESRLTERPRPQTVQRSERRVALVIGNAQYKSSPLENAVNDATDIDQALKRFGFQTTFLRNASLGQIREATRRFADQLTNADVALIYFAGHGIESKNKNYMIPVNADLKFEYELADQAYDAAAWLEMLEMIKSNNAERVNIVILDACRNNNLIGSRSLNRGLARMDAPTGTFLSYSTAPGKVAADGGRGERNSPFTKNLLRAIQQPGLPIEEVFKEVRRNVTRETNGAQVPWESTSLTGFFSFRQTR